MKNLCIVKTIVDVSFFESMFTVGSKWNGVVSRGLPKGAELAGITCDYGRNVVEISFRVPLSWCKKMDIGEDGIVDVVLQGPI